MRMSYPIAAGIGTAPSTTATQYVALNVTSDGGWNATETNRSTYVSASFRMSGLTVIITNAPGTGITRTFKVMRNGTATDIVVNIAGASDVTGTTTNFADFEEGDTISLEASVTGGTAAAAGRTSWYSTATMAEFQNISGNNVTSANTGSTSYLPLMGQIARTSVTTEANMTVVAPCAGSFSGLRVTLTAGSPGAGKSYAVTLRKGGVDTALTCTISDSATSATDLTNIVHVNAGDLLSLSCTPTGTPTARALKTSMRFVPDNDGDSIYLFGTSAAPSTTAVRYEELYANGGFSWVSSESARQVPFPASVTISKMYVNLGTAPASGKSWNFRIRKNGAGAGPTVTISDTATTGNNSTTTSTAAGDLIALEATPTSTPTAPGTVNIGICFNMSTTSQGVVGMMGAEIQDSGASPLYGDSGLLSGTSSVVASGTTKSLYAFRTNPTTTATGSVRIAGVANDSTAATTGFGLNTAYISFVFKPATISSNATGEQILAVRSWESTTKATIRLDSGGKLRVYNTSGTLVATGATTLVAGTEYYIRFNLTAGAAGAYNLYINGVSELSGTGNWDSYRIGHFELGKFADVNGTSVDYYFDDVYVSDTGYVGTNPSVYLLYVNGPGAINEWTTGGAPSDYTVIDETTPNTADYIGNTASSVKVCDFALIDSPANTAIHAIRVVALGKVTATTAYMAFPRIVTTNGTWAPQFFNNTATSNILWRQTYSTDPSNGAAWSTSLVDSMTVGATGLGDATQKPRIDWLGVELLYEPSTATTPQRTLVGAGK